MNNEQGQVVEDFNGIAAMEYIPYMIAREMQKQKPDPKDFDYKVAVGEFFRAQSLLFANKSYKKKDRVKKKHKNRRA